MTQIFVEAIFEKPKRSVPTIYFMSYVYMDLKYWMET